MDQPFQIVVQLYSEELDSTETEVLFFTTFPTEFQEIKDKIEKLLFIPSCLQTVWVHGSKVHESLSCSPSSLYLQNGDTIKISYPMKCEVDGVKNAVKWMADTVTLFQKINNCTKEEQVTSLLETHGSMFHSNYLVQFGSLFLPWTDKTKEINTIYFDYLGGIGLLIETQKEVIAIYDNTLLTSYNVATFLHYIDSLESTCCVALANIARSSEYCRRITERGGLDTCIEVFLRNLIDHKKLESADDALVAICNISDIPENHLYISQRKDMISQIPTVIARPSDFSIWAATDAISIFLNAAQCREAHMELLQPDIIQEVIQSLNCRSICSGGNKEISVKMLFWYAGISQAQMVLGSTHLLQNFPEATLHGMIALMNEACTYDPKHIKKYELDKTITWTSFQHLLFLYEPDISSCGTSQNPSINQVCLLSVNVLLHSFQCTLEKEKNVEVASEEGLIEYFVMLPWTVPSTLQEQAKCVVREIAKHHQIQPPSLCSLSKAKLAKMKWGLKKFQDMDSISQLLSDLNLN